MLIFFIFFYLIMLVWLFSLFAFHSELLYFDVIYSSCGLPGICRWESNWHAPWSLKNHMHMLLCCFQLFSWQLSVSSFIAQRQRCTEKERNREVSLQRALKKLMTKDEDFKLLNIQSCTCSLKMNTLCDGSKPKVRTLIQRIEDVYQVNIDADQQKVTCMQFMEL